MKQFWEIEKEENYYTLEKINEKEIAEAEKKLGVTLPDTYKKLILEQNGGYIFHNAFHTTQPNSWSEDHIQFTHLRGIAEDDGIMESEYLIEEWDLPKGLILINGDGHTWVTMDYRNTKEDPSIHYFDLEMEEDFKLADSFDEFIEGLYTAEYTVDEEATEVEYELPEVYLSKEEFEAILKMEEPHTYDIYKLECYPMLEIKEIEWFFKKLRDYIPSVKDELTLHEIASSIDSILLQNQKRMPKSEELIEILQQIIEFLENHEMPEVVNVSEHLAMKVEDLNS
ncbi:SMI1/KNR4 family protein [Bacillus safensis]|uniref:SMI1/KNR4 family protein n=2 Tax=Bacillus safensis TaxID=561879 RepID=UPI000DAB3D0B|nr:SMI1/KNR4 family protein [Bacillus safensis]